MMQNSGQTRRGNAGAWDLAAMQTRKSRPGEFPDAAAQHRLRFHPPKFCRLMSHAQGHRARHP
jgi:hypothetical protein